MNRNVRICNSKNKSYVDILHSNTRIHAVPWLPVRCPLHGVDSPSACGRAVVLLLTGVTPQSGMKAAGNEVICRQLGSFRVGNGFAALRLQIFGDTGHMDGSGRDSLARSPQCSQSLSRQYLPKSARHRKPRYRS